MSLAVTGKAKEKAERFYDELLGVLLKNNMPFMVGGTFAFKEYTGIERPTGDIDIKTTVDDYPRLLKTLSKAGFKTELIEPRWLAKVYKDDFYTDIIFAESNNLHKIDKSWFKYARLGTVLGHHVKLEPVEELIRSKCYVQNRDRHDGFDVVHLILRQGKTFKWELLVSKIEPHWELLMSHILTFMFVYPSEREIIPKWVIERLVSNLKDRVSHPATKNKITRGLLLSNDYKVGVSKFGFSPITELK